MRTLFLVIATLGLVLALPAIHSDPNLKIYGGKTAEPGQFPFIVSINSTIYQHEWCVGSILNQNWILTTATCTALSDWKADQVVVISGTNQLNAVDDGATSKINQIVIHPNFTIGFYDQKFLIQNNVALFKTEEPLVYSDLVQPIELGEAPADVSATVAGWGLTETDHNPALQYLEVSIWTNENCAKQVADWSAIGDDEVCAFGGKGTGFCTGDMAAPLVYNGTLVGVASWAIHPCGGGAPDVYSRVSYFADWIEEIVVC